MIERDGFVGIGQLGVPGNKVAQFFGLGVLHNPGMSSKENHHSILAPHFARQVVVENLHETLKARVLILELDHFIETQSSQSRRYRMRAFQSPGTFGATR